jgi:MFS transporter, PAT family, beta-lactamase induction signal transducer AmpG
LPITSSQPDAVTAAPRSTRDALAVFIERRALVMVALGFAAGLPFLLIFDTLSAWLRQVGLSLEVIGFFSLATLVYSFKFLWAPFIDRTSVPFLTDRLGHRRSWMLVCQGLIIAWLALLAGRDPAQQLGTMALLAVLVGFSSATQDIAIDAWRIEVTDESRQGVMAAAYQWGYRIATITAGAVPLVLAGWFGWNLSYGVMAALMGIGVLATLAAPREARHKIRAIHLDDVANSPVRDRLEWAARLALLSIGALIIGSGLAANASLMASIFTTAGMAGFGETLVTAWRSPSGLWFQMLAVVLGFIVIAAAVWPIPGARTRPGVYLGTALGEPLKEFFSRYGRLAGPILALLCIYRLSDFLLNIMNPFYLDLGFTLTEVAEVRKIFGVAATLAGVFAGGYAIARFGLFRPLLVGAFGGSLSNLIYVWLAMRGHDLTALFVAIGVENVAGGFAGTCLIAYMSSLTAVGFTATQYALFSSFYAIPGKILASQSGRIVEATAHAADRSGALGVVNRLFAHLPPESFAQAMERSGVSPAALALGYSAFFVYSCVVGLAAVALTIIVVRGERDDAKVSREASGR